MAVRRMHSIIAVLMVLVIAGFFVICNMEQADAYVNPSAAEETAKTEQTAASDTKAKNKTESSAKAKKKSKSSEQNNNYNNNSSSAAENSADSAQSDSDDEDILDENAFTTPGNASLGDVIRDSGSKDFYTIRTDNDNTYYLVIDHSGNMDNVYMLSTIDENDLKDFLEDESNISGSVILPEKTVTEETEPAVETPEKEPEKNRLSGIISLVVLAAMGIAGFVFFKRYRRRQEEPEEDYTENMEDDGLPTVNEDEEFLG